MLKRTRKATVQALVVMLGSCLVADWPAVSAQGPQVGAPVTAASQDAVAPGNQLSPLPYGFSDVLPDGSGGDSDGLSADCGGSCAPSWLVRAEAMFFANEGHGPVSLSDAYSLSEFGYEGGMRVTVGRKRDCLDGWEISYAGPFEWEVARGVHGFPLNSDFQVPNADINISAFNGAEYHLQTYESSLQSCEFNKRWDDWNTMSALIGLRYFGVDETFTFYSLDPLPLAEEGLFTVRTRNHLIGPQCGMDLFYPVSAANRLSLAFKTKLGIYANFADGGVRLVNAGVEELNNSADEVAFAFQGELGLSARLRITPRLSLRGGYEIWYLSGLALADGQTVSPLTPATGRSLDEEQDTWYHGVTLGGDYTW